MLNLNAAIDLDFKKFLRWWGRELAFLFPAQLIRLFAQPRGRFVLIPDQDRLRLAYELPDSHETMAEFTRDGAGFAELKKYLTKDGRLEKSALVIRFTARDAIGRELQFPLAAAVNLLQVIGYELDRYTPFTKDQVYFDVKVLEQNKQTGQIRIALILLPKDRLDVVEEALSAVGLSATFVDYDGVPSFGDNPEPLYNLLPLERRQKSPILSSLIHGALSVSCLLLFILALVLPVWWANQEVSELREQVEKIEREAKEVDNLQAEIDAIITQTRQLIKIKQQSPSLVELLNALSQLIKDDTWLNHLQFSGGRLQFQGQSPTASALIAILEGSDLFANARFVSPVTQDATTGLERFQITVDAKSRSADDAGQ